MSGPLLDIQDLHVAFSTRAGLVEAVRGIDLQLAPGGTLAVVGESGSGKSVTAYAVTQLLDRAARIPKGRILYRGEDITRADPARMKALRGAAISMVFQSPRTALNPIRPIGLQVMDAIAAHENLPKAVLRARALELLEAVRIHDAAKRFEAYPAELSGGMCQRVMIAMAIACNPSLLIADEPTTGLDVTTQKTAMDLIAGLTAERGMALILITHDLGLAASYCRDVMVMQQGRVVEAAGAVDIFRHPSHPYTRRLVAASPTPTSTVDELVGEAPRAARAPSTGTREARVLLDASGIVKRFGSTLAVEDVSLTLKAGESLGLVGESGSGKSTLSRLICRLADTDGGRLMFDGVDIGAIPLRAFPDSPWRREIQIVFQDPHESLNPRFTAFECIARPVRRLAKLRDAAQVRRRVEEVADRCGLSRDLLTRFPHQLSGGQKARIGIARAIAVEPRLLVLDEPTAALDVSVQAVVLKLLDDLRRDAGLAFLFVSHDLNVVRMMCERTIVMRHGRIVEEGESHALFRNPQAAYTRELLGAIPHFEPMQAATA